MRSAFRAEDRRAARCCYDEGRLDHETVRISPGSGRRSIGPNPRSLRESGPWAFGLPPAAGTGDRAVRTDQDKATVERVGSAIVSAGRSLRASPPLRLARVGRSRRSCRARRAPPCPRRRARSRRSAAFSSIRSRCVDFGITIVPRCRHQRMQHLGRRAADPLRRSRDTIGVTEVAAGPERAVGLERDPALAARLEQRAPVLERAELDLVDDRRRRGDAEHLRRAPATLKLETPIERAWPRSPWPAPCPARPRSGRPAASG